jgi:hypothetical protein
MSYQPVTQFGGVAGWAFLNRTLERQTDSFNNSAEFQREAAYFREKIGEITSAKELVADRQLLKIALGAFGLEDDLDKQFFVRKVLEEGTEDSNAMANRLVDTRYGELTDAFGFGSSDGYRTKLSNFANEITSAYETRQFEVAVGENDQSLRLALNFRREIANIASQDSSGDTGWYNVLGSASLRSVVEQAFNLPDEFAYLDIDRQISTLKEKARAEYGSDDISVFLATENVEDMVQNFLVRSDLTSQTAGVSGASAALTLMQQSGQSSAGSGTLEALFAALYS